MKTGDLFTRREATFRQSGSYYGQSQARLCSKAATILQPSLYAELLERLSVRGRFKRQPHIKLCAIRTRAEVDFSVMPFDDDPVADNQAESRA